MTEEPCSMQYTEKRHLATLLKGSCVILCRRTAMYFTIKKARGQNDSSMLYVCMTSRLFLPIALKDQGGVRHCTNEY